MKKVVVIDNYDSFTYNLVHAIEEILGYGIDVVKNDQVSLDELDSYDYFFLSPGPGVPEEAGLLNEILDRYKDSKKILGVCLGLQAIAESYGYSLKNLEKVYHGIQSKINIDYPSILYSDLEDGFLAGRYHSWVMKENENKSDLIVTARSIDGNVMSIEHKSHKVYGVQYHPESFMTDKGRQVISNFLEKA